MDIQGRLGGYGKRINLICGENCDLRDSRIFCSGSGDDGVCCDGVMEVIMEVVRINVVEL